MKLIHLKLITFLLLIINVFLLFYIVNNLYLSTDIEKEELEISSFKDDLNDSLVLSQKWFDNFQDDELIIKYMFSPTDNEFIDERNIVREVGSFWGYTRLYNHHKNPKSLEKINRIRATLNDYIKYDHIEGLDIAYLEHDGIALVNTQAFYLLAMSELSKAGVKLTQKEKDDMKKIINGLYLMKADEGGLWYVYYLPKEHNKISPYGTSEALYGLISYYKYVERDENVLNFAKLVFDEYYLVSKKYSFADEEARSFYSWILYFLVELVSEDDSYYFQIEELIEKGLDYRKNNQLCQNRGCLMFPVTASEAAFLEGGIYSYKILKNNEFERLDELNNYINLTLSDVLSMQILSAQDYIDKTNHSYEGDVDLLIGAYCSGRNDGLYYCQYLRNDITQHASSAVLNYYNLYEEFN